MTDILNQRAPRATPPRPHPVIDAIIAAGRAAAELRNQHHADGHGRRQEIAKARAELRQGGTA